MNTNLMLACASALVMGVVLVPAPATTLAPTSVICDNTAATALSGTYTRVTVKPGDSCYLDGATVLGGVLAIRPVTVSIIDTRVDRNIKVTGATRNVVIGNENCRFDPFTGNNLEVKDSHNVGICWMSVDNNIKVSGNDGRISLRHNRAGNSISVTNNLAYNALPGDGQHANAGAIRFRHNTAGSHNTVRNNAGRGLIAADNTPAVRR